MQDNAVSPVEDLSVTERMFQLSTTENKYQFDEEQNRETRNRTETPSRKTDPKHDIGGPRTVRRLPWTVVAV